MTESNKSYGGKNSLERLKEWHQFFGTWSQNPVQAEQGVMRSDLYPYTHLFEPITIRKMKIRNRIMMAPMGTINLGEQKGRPSKDMVAFYEARARGGVGLISSGLVPVAQGIDPTLREKDGTSYFPEIVGSRTLLSGWRDCVQACHAHGARFIIQLSVGLGRVGNPECLQTIKRFPRSASFNPNHYLPEVPCLRLSDHRLKQIIKRLAQASAEVKGCGADGVYLHGHEGYLLEQMTNPAFNRRKIGRYRNPQQFGLDCVRAVRKKVGSDYPIFYRIDLSLLLTETYQERLTKVPALKRFKKERTLEETLAYMKELVKAGVDAFDVDLGCYENWWLPHPPTYMPAGCFLEVAQLCRNYFAENQIVNDWGQPIPIMAVGKLGNPDLAEKALRDQQADMILLGRPLLADPEWVNKAYSGRIDSIRPCIGCQDACLQEFVEGGHPACSVNPQCGFEAYTDPATAPIREAKRIAVVGAGPAGVICAATAAKKGHEVWLFDQQPQVGGLLCAGTREANKVDVKNYLQWLRNLVKKTQKEGNLHYCPETVATVSMLEDQRFDVIVCATGSKAKALPVPAAYPLPTAQSILENPHLAADKKEVVIVGGGLVGMELAFQLSQDESRHVTVIEASNALMRGSCSANRGYLIHYLEKPNVKVHLCSFLKEVLPDEVKVRINTSKTVPDPWVTWTPLLPESVHNPFARSIEEQWEEQSIPCDLCITAVGQESETTLSEQLRKNYCAPKVLTIGDAFQPGNIRWAVKAGYRTGLEL